jgi:probable phosphoglycerate mutase
MALRNTDSVSIGVSGHFSRVFIARWCNLALAMGYHFQCDAGGLNILGYQHNTLKEPSLIGLNWFAEDRCG